MSEKREEVLVHRSRRRFVLRLVQGVIATAIGLWRLAEVGWVPNGDQDRLLLVSLSWVLVVGGLWLIVWSLQSIRGAKSAVIRISSEGLSVERPAVGTLPWGAIGPVRAQRIRSRQYLHITVTDPALVASLHQRLQGAIVERELWFDVSDLDLDAQDLAALIEEGKRGESFTDPRTSRTPFG